MDVLHAAIQKYTELLTQEVEKERKLEEALKRHAAKTHEHLADGYWEARWSKELRLRAAVALLDAMCVAKGEG